MAQATPTPLRFAAKTRLERLLSLASDVRPGEGLTAVLLLANIFLLLICYSVIKTVREPLILLGGGAEVRSYAAAGQAFLLMGFVPLYGWFASKVNRAKLVVGVTLFFIACIEVFALAVAARTPYVGVAFFIWVGIFNVSLVAQFWSFASDLYSKESGDRLFPIIVVGMTAGAPLGSFVAGRLFRLGFTPQVILQVSALLLALSAVLYLLVNRRETPVNSGERLSAEGGFKLVLGNRYLLLVALLVTLLNIVNTTGEYLVAKLLTLHVGELVAANPAFNRQAYIGAFAGDYQFWVNVMAFMLQAFVASRLIKYKGLAGVLLALPLIALGGYSIIAAGAGFSIVRWIKTVENATDYSIMNTARQLLWLPTTREEKYKAKQAIDTFFVRSGDVLSASVVALGTGVLHLSIEQFAAVNIALTLVWIAVAVVILKPSFAMPRLSWTPMASRAAAIFAVSIALAGTASAQESRAEQLANERAEKAQALHPYVPDALERHLERADRVLSSERPAYLFLGSPFDGGGLAVGPGYRAKFGDSGAFNAHAAWSIRNFKEADATVKLPTIGHDRLNVSLRANWLDAPGVPFFGTGGESSRDDRSTFLYRATTVGAAARMKVAGPVAVGASFDAVQMDASAAPGTGAGALDPTYRKAGAFAEVDTRTSPDYSRSGGLYRVDVTDYRQVNEGQSSFRRIDAEVQQFVPILRENWVLAFRALASTTDADSGDDVPYFLMPDLGGSRMLRGFSAWRFRDRHRMLLTGEYRWTAGPLLDMALFVDAGKVASGRADLNFSNLEVSQGIGMRIHTPSTTVTRIELARSREGLSLIFSFSPSF